MSLKIKESELQELLEEVAGDLAKAFESEKEKLAKAEGSAETSPMAKDAPPPTEETPGEASASASGAPDASADAPPVPEASESTMSPDGAPAPDGMDPAADAGAALTPEALQAEYCKLPPEELDMHIKAALAAKAATAAPAPDAGMAPPSPDMSAPPAGPSAPPMGPPAMKAELNLNASAQGGKITHKHEREIAELRDLVKSQAEDTENLTKAIKFMLEAPQRKAVTSVAHLPKVESEKAPMTRSDVHKRLNELSQRPDLKKSDRQLINDFFDGKVKADKLAPLFEDSK